VGCRERLHQSDIADGPEESYLLQRGLITAASYSAALYVPVANHRPSHYSFRVCMRALCGTLFYCLPGLFFFGDAWALRGRVYLELDKPKRALADLQRALQFSPGKTNILLDMAGIYRQQGEHQRCLTTLQHLLDSCSPGEEPYVALLLEGQTLSDLGRWDDARIRFLAIRKRASLNADLLYLLAQSEYMTDRPKSAATTVQEALLANASHIPSQQLLAKLGEQTSESTGTSSESTGDHLLR
jgi:tetratricopeptide (TPR) repeat protein